MAGYIDRNPVKAKMVRWPDGYEWCSFAAAAKGDARCVDGYRFIYSVFAPLTWERIREMHEKSIHLVLKELEDERLAGRAKKGLSVDDEAAEGKTAGCLSLRAEQDRESPAHSGEGQ